MKNPIIDAILRDPNVSQAFKDGLAPHRRKLAPGQCPYCDRERNEGNNFHPAHDASPRCQSGKRPHCSCDACF